MIPPDRDRLVKILGMLGSPHAGEVLAAAKAASALVETTHTTWNDLIKTRKDEIHQEALQTQINLLLETTHRVRGENYVLRIRARQLAHQLRREVRVLPTLPAYISIRYRSWRESLHFWGVTKVARRRAARDRRRLRMLR